MTDIPENQAADQASRDVAAKKSTTRLIPLPLIENRPESSPATGDKENPAAMLPSASGSAPLAKEGIQPGGAPPNPKMQTMRINLDNALSPPAKPIDRKNVTMPISELMATEQPVPGPIDRKNVTMPISELMEAEDAPGSASKFETSPMNVPTVGVARPRSGERSKNGNGPDRDSDKKNTSRITVAPRTDDASSREAKRSTSPITVIPQTIRLKRTSGLTQALPIPAKARTDLISEAPTLGRMPDLSQAKMVTARILVDPEETENIPPASAKRGTSVINIVPGSEPIPQTINLKRPVAASLAETGEAGLASEAPTIMKAGVTGGNAPEENGPATISQRKTIKIKRTESNLAAPRTVKLRQPNAPTGTAPKAVIGQAPATIETEETSPIFFAVAVGVVILMAGLVYVMAAQAFGPDLVLPMPESLL